VSSRSGMATLRTAIHLLLTYFFTQTVRNKQDNQRLSLCSFLSMAFSVIIHRKAKLVDVTCIKFVVYSSRRHIAIEADKCD